MARRTRLETAADAVNEQRRWIAEHGGDEAGYVARYGDSGVDPALPASEGGRDGLGGQAIYAADLAALARYEAILATRTAERVRVIATRARRSEGVADV